MSEDEVREYLQDAKGHLSRALSLLEDARGWSIADIFLGGFLGLIAGAFKYSNLDRAKDEVKEAARLVEKARELSVSIPEIDHTMLWMVFDIGFDNPIIDFLKHRNIDEAKKKLRETIATIDKALMKS